VKFVVVWLQTDGFDYGFQHHKHLPLSVVYLEGEQVSIDLVVGEQEQGLQEFDCLVQGVFCPGQLVWNQLVLHWAVKIFLALFLVFAEGESELVSGFNIEYGRLGFALIFMAEYASIFLIGLIFSFIFITPRCLNLFTYFFSTLVVRGWV